MTTIVTVVTAACPASVSCVSSSETNDGQSQHYSHQSSTVFVPADTRRDFTISKGANVYVTELEEGAPGLPCPPSPGTASAPATGTAAASTLELQPEDQVQTEA